MYDDQQRNNERVAAISQKPIDASFLLLVPVYKYTTGEDPMQVIKKA